jgi:hypothetical protein
VHVGAHLPHRLLDEGGTEVLGDRRKCVLLGWLVGERLGDDQRLVDEIGVGRRKRDVHPPPGLVA